MKASQSEIILQSLKDAGSEGLHPTYFIVNLHIYQYSARIHELREMFNCQCKHGNNCSANEHIKNKDMHDGTTKFYYVDSRPQIKSTMEKYRQEAIAIKNKQDDLPLFLNNEPSAKFYKVPSFTDETKTYIVRLLPNGDYRCDCASFVFHNNKHCKHILKIYEENRIKNYPLTNNI